jgi:hypothetical protein
MGFVALSPSYTLTSEYYWHMVQENEESIQIARATQNSLLVSLKTVVVDIRGNAERRQHPNYLMICESDDHW